MPSSYKGASEREGSVADYGKDSGVVTGASLSLRKNATRSSLAFAAHRRLGLSRSESRRLVDDIFSVLSDFLQDHGSAKVSSFGSFSVRSKDARVGRNPRTGEVVPIAPRRVVSFRPSSALRARLREDFASGEEKREEKHEG